MSHPLYNVTDFELLGRYRVSVVFDDGLDQSINLEPILHGELYGPLRDLALFKQVRLDPEIKTLVWSNGADFDPYVLHEWPHVVDD